MPSRTTEPPLVSVIIATYNRSNVLALAIDSVKWQTHTNWELWVIGDACTDDTAEVVAAFNDPRIRFHNLPENIGEQSGPNNEGVRRARGDFVAFLNHDDLWLPDHLECALAELEATGADMVHSILEKVHADGRKEVCRISRDRRYRPGPTPAVPASSWLVRRTLIDEIGPWRYFREIHNIPSQDWLHRAWKAGKTIRTVPRLTVVAFGSASRPGCYANRDDHEQTRWLARMRDEPDFREHELTDLVFNLADNADTASTRELALHPPRRLLAAFVHSAWRTLLLTLKIHPTAYKNWRRYRRKGGAIDRLRKNRGLDPVDSPTSPV